MTPIAVLIRDKRGMSLIEIIVATGIVALLILGVMQLLISSSRATERITTQSDVDTGVGIAAERVSAYLRDARTFTIDSDGMGITYSRPVADSNGKYTIDNTAVESASHRIYVSNGRLYQSDSTSRPLLTNIPTIDPETNAALTVFSAGVNSKQIVIRLVSQKSGARTATRYTAITTCVRPRNIQ